jgi:hypothetical protein
MIKVTVSELSGPRIPPDIITTLVGGPCDGQKVDLHLFDGRSWMSAFKQVPAYVKPYKDQPRSYQEHCTHAYRLREFRHPNSRAFVVFADPELSDSEVIDACEKLRKRSATDAMWDSA